MRLTCFNSGSCVPSGRRKVFFTGALLLMLAAGALPCGQGQQNQTQQNPAAPANPASAPAQAASASQTPAVPAPPVAQDQAVQNPATPQDQHAITESAALLKLATELKAAVDKSSKDTLSLAVIRKADEIERVARGMKDKYRASAGIN
jgi:glucose/arabinose dehydrogenase